MNSPVGDRERSPADAIILIAVNLNILLGVIRHLRFILLVLGIAEKNTSGYFRLESSWELADGIVHDSGSLA